MVKCTRGDGDTVQLSPGLEKCHLFAVLWRSLVVSQAVLWDAGLLITATEGNIWLLKRQRELKSFSGDGWEGGLCLHRRWSTSLKEDGYLLNPIAQVLPGHCSGREPPAACVGTSALLGLIHPNRTNKTWTRWAFNTWESSGVRAVPHLHVSRDLWWRAGPDRAYLWMDLVPRRQERHSQALTLAAASNC